MLRTLRQEGYQLQAKYRNRLHGRIMRHEKINAPVQHATASKAELNMPTAKQQKVEELYNMHRKPNIPDMPASKLWQLIQAHDSELLVVDTRQRQEQQVSVLPGPVMTQQEFESKMDEFRGKDLTVVCYCTVGLRSANAAQKYQQQGFDAYNLEGSILGWTYSGYPLVELADRSKETKRVHVFGPGTALQAEGYEPVMFDSGGMTFALAKMVGGDVLHWLRRLVPWRRDNSKKAAPVADTQVSIADTGAVDTSGEETKDEEVALQGVARDADMKPL